MSVDSAAPLLVYDLRRKRSSATTAWQSALSDAGGVLPIVLVGSTPFYLDVTPGASQQYLLSSGQIVRGQGNAVIRAINGDSTSTSGSGLYVSAVSADRTRVFLEYLNVEGENGSGWGDGNDHAYSFVSNYQTLVSRFVANGTGTLRDFGVRFNRFAYLDGFPSQVIAELDKVFGGYFDFNTLYRVNRALNCSAPYSSISFNKFEESQVAEFAAQMMVLIGNVAKKHYGGFSCGASGVADGRYYGQIVALNGLDEQSQTNAGSQIITTDGTLIPLIVGNWLRRARLKGMILGGSGAVYGSPLIRVALNAVVSAGNVAGNPSGRIAVDVYQDYADVDLNTVYNDPADAGTWETQYGLRVQSNYGGYDRNRLDGTTWHVQFDGTAGGTRAIQNYWGAGNIYDPAKVSFIQPPTGQSYFLDGSFMRFNRNGVTGQLPTQSVAYRGLRASVQDSVSGKGDAEFKGVIAPSGNYVWQAQGEALVRTITNASFTATRYDRMLFFSTGAVGRTLTLPAVASSENVEIVVKKIDSGIGKVTLDGNGAETIDGAATYDLAAQYKYVRIKCDGAAWYIVGNN